MSALRFICWLAAWAAIGVATGASAQSVGLSGMLGGKALLIVDGSPPKAVTAGDTFRGVKVISTQGDEAVVEIGGKRHSMQVGDVTVYDVDGMVTYGSMPYVLLGNSFLARFQMTRTNDQMVLEKRF